MRAFVFTDKSLERQAGRFVWLAMNTERAKTAPLRKQFPVSALPTYLIVDSRDEKVALRWVGGATVPQLNRMLDDGVASIGRKQGVTGVEVMLARADSLYGAQNDSGAVEAYRRVLFLLPEDRPDRARVVDAMLYSLQRTDDSLGVVALAHAELPRYRHTSTGLGLALGGLDAALGMSAANLDRAGLLAEFEAAARAALADSTITVSADDRSSVYGSLVEARKEAGDEAGMRQTAEDWAAFLERAATAAATPEQRAVFDSHRLSAYLQLAEPERAVPFLQESERALPDDYNPPARLAIAYRAMGRWDDALAASDRALAKAYGPRRLGILQTRADIYIGKGDKEAARRTLQQAVAEAEALPAGQRSESVIAGIQKKLAAIE